MANEFKFLITTDNHLGFKYDDSTRRKDSFMAFSEALQIAREKDVDFILLGGDLFHMNKPNPVIEHKCIKIIRQHMNIEATKRTTFKRISGEFSHLERVKHGNFEDPSLSVPYPIFTIHGNHDDPMGPNGKSVCEKLATCGLLNYFGKVKQLQNDRDIHIEPIVIEKNGIKIALYGIGFIPDKKLCSAFRLNYVKFKEPHCDTFNILVVHQNRLKYDADKYIPDSVFPDWFHLIIRGHEHDAQTPEPIPGSKVGGIVYQPGSTVATSIEMRESAVKQVGLMSVKFHDPQGDPANRYKLDYDIIDLKCYRRILFRDIYQKEVFEYIKRELPKKNEGPRQTFSAMEYRNVFRKYVMSQIEALLEEYSKDSQASTSHVDVVKTSQASSSTSSVYEKLHRIKLPILRVRLEYVKKSEIFDDLEINSLFYPNQVANSDIIKFRRQRVVIQPDGKKTNLTFSGDTPDNQEIDDDDIGEVETIDLQEERKETIDTMIMNYFNEKPAKDRLKAISLDEYTSAVNGSNEDGSVIAKVLKKKKHTTLLDFRCALQDDEIAAAHFNTEAKVYDWFIRAFRGEKPQLPEASPDLPEDWDEAEMDDDVVVLE